MDKEKQVKKNESNNKIEPKIKKKYKTIENILKNKNFQKKKVKSNQKEIQLSKKSENLIKKRINNNKMIINNIINEDKELEALLSILKTTLSQKSQYNKNEKYLNINKTRRNIDLLYDNDCLFSNKKENFFNNNNNTVNFHIDDEEHEISQRVHSKNPVSYINFENKLKNKNTDKNIENSNSKRITLNILNKLDKNINKGKMPRQNNSNIKFNTLNNKRLSNNNNHTNLIKYKTFKSKIDSNILNKFKNESQKNKYKILDIKKSSIYKRNKVNKIIINIRKNNNNSLNKSNLKTSLCSPKSRNIDNKALIYSSYANKLTKKNIKSYNMIRDLYIKDKSFKQKNHINKNKFVNFNRTMINPFINVNYEIGKGSITKKVNYYIENIYGKNKMKKLYENSINNHKNSRIIQYNIKKFNSEKDINISN